MSLERRPSTGAFVLSRVTRLFPSYWVSVAVTFAVVAVLGMPDYDFTLISNVGLVDYDVSVTEALWNLTMVHSPFGVTHVDGVYWTLIIELAFYTWMIVMLRLGWLSRPERLAGVVLVIFLATNVFILALSWRPSVAVYNLLLLAWGNLFLAGIMFYRLRTLRPWSAVPIIFGTLVIEFLLRPDSLWLVCLLYVLFTLLAFDRLRVLAARPLFWLGAISYPLYLTHQNIGYIVINRLYGAGFDNPAIVIGVPILLALALATAIHRFVEVPGQRVLRDWLRRRPLSDRLVIPRPLGWAPPTMLLASIPRRFRSGVSRVSQHRQQ